MKTSHYLRGVLGMSGSAVLFSGMALLISYAEGVSFFTIALFRFIIGLGILTTLAIFRQIRLEFNNRLLLFLRGLFGGIGVTLFYLAIVKIGIAKGTVISNTFPVFATLGGVLFLKDRVRPLVWLSLGFSLIGLALLTRSTWSSGFSGENDLWVVWASIGAVAGGAAIVCVKRLRETDTSVSIFLSQSLIGFWIVLVPAGLTASKIGLGIVWIMVGVGALATLAQLLMTWSFAHVPISTGSLLSLLTPVCNVILGVLLFKETLTTGEAIGSALILLACAVVAVLGKEPIAVRR
ncbi:MAG: DMT family transporter [Spirochaetaceae bacterium]|nr:MAG: DMT family transporter [Spirochaetaceae bacterium]